MSIFCSGSDQQPAVLRTARHESRAYSPYGSLNGHLGPGLAFCGYYKDALTGHYPLGKGRRFYNPVLMRFQVPDPLSPFARGGMNGYAYCSNDPVNYTDPSGLFLQYAAPARSILNGMVNLGITAYKFLRDMRITRRYFASDPEFAGSRQGHLATGTIESPMARLDWKQKTLMAVGGTTALTSIGTGVARLAGANSSALTMADFVAGSIATASSLVEVGKLVVQQLDARYPIQPHVGTIRSREPSPSPSLEWQFASGPTPSSSYRVGRHDRGGIFIIEEQRSNLRETAV
ncbi:RHS repeat-associated core domain-containing protein [Pseudomonas entomophila]|uniref:RHS repeat-associated core domain-containing protein n=1 Tax=Pseudomonas entomophila TaxID=312306 RepID=UPI003EBE536F